jgi:hypothetical protein
MMKVDKFSANNVPQVVKLTLGFNSSVESFFIVPEGAFVTSVTTKVKQVYDGVGAALAVKLMGKTQLSLQPSVDIDLTTLGINATDALVKVEKKNIGKIKAELTAGTGATTGSAEVYIEFLQGY